MPIECVGIIGVIASLGGLIVTQTIVVRIADLLTPYFQEVLRLKAAQARAEHEAKIKLIRGLD